MSGQLGGERALVAGPEEVPCDTGPSGSQPVAEMGDRPRTEGDVDERVQLEDALALGLRIAAADRDHPLGVPVLERLRVAEVGRETLVRLLPDRAGVEDEDVGAVRRIGLPEPKLLEHALDALRVVRVHLAAEGGDVVAAHRRQCTQASWPAYFANSMARLSRMTVTLIWPGYSRCPSMSRAISCDSRIACSSSISVGLTITRISRPAWRA